MVKNTPIYTSLNTELAKATVLLEFISLHLTP